MNSDMYQRMLDGLDDSTSVFGRMVAEIGLTHTIVDIVNGMGEHHIEGLLQDLASADVDLDVARAAVGWMIREGMLREIGDGLLCVARDN